MDLMIENSTKFNPGDLKHATVVNKKSESGKHPSPKEE